MTTWYNAKDFFVDLNRVTVADYEIAVSGTQEADMPKNLKDWLGRLRLFYGLPFEYLVPDESLLPSESIRFFYVDRNWSDRMVDGALSVGKTTSREFAHHQAVFSTVATALDFEERRVRPRLRPAGTILGEGRAVDITGFLLRSRVVSGWPGLEVKAYRGEPSDKSPLRLLRMDRLGPDVLLCLFDGIPDIVDIEEPREGLQFGVDMNLDGNRNIQGTIDNPSGFSLKIRHMEGDNAGYEVGWVDDETGSVDDIDMDINDRKINVPVREADPQVVHVEVLKETLELKLNSIKDANPGKFEFDDTVGPAELAVQMLQFPFQQRFYGAGRERPLETMPLLELQSIYQGSTIGITTAINALDPAEIDDLTGGS